MKIKRRQLLKGFAASLAGVALSKYSFANADTHSVLTTTLFQSGEPIVFNKGIGGNNTVDLLVRIDADCLPHQPKLTILMAGTNDMNSVKYVPLDQYKANMIELISKIKAVGSKVLLMNILPPYEPYLLTRHPAKFYEPEGVMGRRRQMNEAIAELAKKQKVHLLDIGRRFDAVGRIGLDRSSLIRNEANTHTTDGLHPTADGYRFMALAVYDYIVDHKLPTTDIVCFGDSITKGDGSIDKDSYPAFLKKLLTTVA